MHSVANEFCDAVGRGRAMLKRPTSDLFASNHLCQDSITKSIGWKQGGEL